MRYVAYFRVSTARQGASGLGLEAQQAAVQAFVRARAGEVLATFTEVESGKRADRPQMAAALAAAKAQGAVLLIAKLDRLARNVAFIANLLEAGVEVVAADMPEANRFVLHIMAAVAEQEAKAISTRTKAALAAAKARGVKLGFAACPDRAQALAAAAGVKGGKVSGKKRAACADATAAQIGPLAAKLAAEGRSLRQIAAELDRMGVKPARAAAWSAAGVKNLLARAA